MFIILFVLINIFVYSQECIFENVNWVIDKDENNITLKSNVCNNILFSRAEIIINEESDTINKFYDILTKNLVDFNKYSLIFPKTDIFTEIEKINENRSIFYAQLDFAPFKKREYFVDLVVYKTNKNFTMYWKPLDDEMFNKYYKNNSNINVRYIYGKWTVTKYDSSIMVSVEYHNDWLINNVPKSVLWGFEKSSTINALKNILKYSKISLK